MYIDWTDAVYTIEEVVPLAIFLYGGYKGLEIARLLVGGTYRSRAFWTVALIGAALVLFLATGTSLPIVSYAGGILAFVVIFLALTFFGDSNIRVMKESDFFHRDILRWNVLRKPVVAVMVALNAFVLIALLVLPESNFNNPNPVTGVFILIYFGYAGCAFTYFAAGLIVGARRSADSSLKRYARMLGLSLLSFMLFFTTWIPLSVFGNFVSNAVSSFFMIPASYYIYRGVVSLSPLGKINRAETSPAAVGPPSAHSARPVLSAASGVSDHPSASGLQSQLNRRERSIPELDFP